MYRQGGFSVKGKKDRYYALATELIELVGGEENIDKVIHCVTRLRFYLKDNTIPDKDKIENLNGVMGVVESGGQYQIIVGEAVDEIYKKVISQLSVSDEEISEEQSILHPTETLSLFAKVRYWVNQLIGIITGAVVPVISILAASGIIKSFLAVLTTSNLITEKSNMYLIVNAMADAVFYFLPIMIGFNAAKRMNGNPILTAVVGGIIIHPTILEAASSELNILSIGSINFPFIEYTYSIFPMIIAAWIVKRSENWLKKWVPIYFQSLFNPIVVIFLAAGTTLLITGPVVSWISLGLANGLESLLNLNSSIFGFIIGGLYQILVIFGLHWGIIPLYVNDFANLGYSYLSAIVSIPAVAQGGAALAVAVKSKKIKIKELGYAGAISAFCSITEPAIYGVNLRFRRPFITASIASAVGGFLIGFFNVNMWNIVGSIIGLPSFIDPQHGITFNFWYAVIITVITLMLSFVLTYVWGYNDKMQMQEERQRPKKA